MSYKQVVLITGLKKLFTDGSFSICQVDSLAALLGTHYRNIPPELYAELRVIHCMDYGKMPRDMRNALPRRTIEALSYCTPIGIELDVEDVYQELMKELHKGYEPLEVRRVAETQPFREPVRASVSYQKVSEPPQERGFFKRLLAIGRSES